MRWAWLKLCSFQNGDFIKLTRQKSVIHRRTDSEYSESSSKISSEKEIEEVTEVPRKRCKTRGGKTVTPSQPAKSQKEICELELESTWKEQDLALIVPQFTRQSKVHAELPHPSQLNFLDTYFDESFYELLVTQASSHAHQYMQLHANLLCYFRNKEWTNVTVNERFLALNFLTEIFKKPEISQYCSTNPLLKTLIIGRLCHATNSKQF